MGLLLCERVVRAFVGDLHSAGDRGVTAMHCLEGGKETIEA